MGNGVSKEESESVGYRVLGVQAHSPASKVGMVSFFDFIIAANGIPLRTLDTSFINLIKQSEDKELPLTLYNCKCHQTREVILVPSKKWPGEGMLGVTIRFDSFYKAEEQLLHILGTDTVLAQFIWCKFFVLKSCREKYTVNSILIPIFSSVHCNFILY